MPDRRSPLPAAPRLSWSQAFHAELARLRPGLCAGLEPAPFAAESGDPPEVRARDKRERAANLIRLNARVAGLGDGARPGDAPLSALCLSGGGIRSATFNLGVIQALARQRVLERFDYLSTVSGGGYIGGWLSAWMAREGPAAVAKQLREPTWRAHGSVYNPLAPEPNAVDRLREYSNYLTPKLGLFSADTWAAAAVVLRNLLLNWLVLVPLLAAAVALPQVAMLVAGLEPHPRAASVLAAGALVLALVAGRNVHRDRAASLAGRGDRPEPSVVRRGVLPLVGSALLLALAAQQQEWAAVCCAGRAPWLAELITAASFAALWSIVVPVLGWLPHRPRTRWRAELVALVVSGLVSGAILVALATWARPVLLARPPLYVALALPTLLADYLLARVLFVGIASRAEGDERAPDSVDPVGVGTDEYDAREGRAAAVLPEEVATETGAVRAPDLLERAEHDREWWARLSGWILAVALVWLGVSLLCTLGGWLLEQMSERWIGGIVTAAGGASGVATAVLGRSAATTSGRDGAGARPSRLRSLGLALAAPVFTAFLVISVARVNTALGATITGNPHLLHVTRDLRLDQARPPLLAASALTPRRDLALFLLVPLGMVGLSLAFGRVVDPNRFSLHGFYRNRLVRAYLGASHHGRRPDPFTGFAVDDNVRLHECTRAGASAAERGPLHLVNTALNLVRGERLAWQQRKAESFVMSPLHCGNIVEGYRDTRRYGGAGGVTLGTAIAISGAAANPNMGYHSAPLVTLLMTLFNARLGMWLGNTNRHGDRTYCRSGPRWAFQPLLAELFGLTTSRHPYVNLSDGGHFDNLGLYEVVLRRCRTVVVSDVGCDPAAGFEDLGNAIRKIRIDFGVPIRFERRMRVFARPLDDKADRPGTAAPGERALYCAVARIDYGAVDRSEDGTPAPPGWLLYVKPQLDAAGAPVPLDVYAYGRGSRAFPHEPTSDQWFDEAQFESYRALGEHVIGEVLARWTPDPADGGFAGLRATVERYLDDAYAPGIGVPAGSWTPRIDGAGRRAAPPPPG